MSTCSGRPAGCKTYLSDTASIVHRITGDAENGGLFTLAYSELSVSCGCSDREASACRGRDSFSIVSDSLPVAEGCYLDTASDVHDNPDYTISGIAGTGQIHMVAVDTAFEDTSASTVVRTILSLGKKNGERKTGIGLA